MDRVVISIVNYKQRELLDRCLSQLFALNLPAEWTIAVLDNNSNDGSGTMIEQKYPSVKFFESKTNLGFGGGHNFIFRNFDCDFFIVLNPDVTVLPASIEELIKELKLNDKAAIAGPCLLNPDGTIQNSARRYYDWQTIFCRRLPMPGRQTVIDNHLMKDAHFDKTVDVPWLVGAALAIKKTAFPNNKLFDERYSLYFEDVDLCYFAKKAGWQVLYCPKSKMIHDHQRASTKLLSSALLKHFTSWLKFYFKTKNYKQP